MRKTRFKAKTQFCGGKWVFGFLVIFDDKCPRIYTGYWWQDAYQLHEQMYAVQEKTICEYAGFTDKDNDDIFEGDILSAHLDDLFPENETRLVVKFHDGAFRGWNLEFQTWDDLGDGFATEFKIIGNIHDNPELLEVAKDD